MKSAPLLAVVIALLVACGDGGPAASSSPPATAISSSPTTASTIASSPTTATTSPVAPTEGKFSVGDHELYLLCEGEGSPTFILEHGEGQGREALSVLAQALAERGTVCSYDRANVGRSGTAPKPRSAQDAADDLNRLLTGAEVTGPYLVIGHSAGGMLVQLFARVYPDDIIGVIAMNPVPPFGPWLSEAFAVMSPEEQEAERAYFEGENGEALDYATSSEQIVAAPTPPNVPFVIFRSGLAQCENPDDVCSRVMAIEGAILAEVAAEWPQGSLVDVAVGHEIYVGGLDEVLGAIEAMIATAG